MWTDQIDPQAARDLMVRTVEIPSLSGQETGVATFLCDWMNAHQFKAQIDPAGNAVGERGTGPLTVVLLGHMDTVPGDIPVRIDESGVLHGRGSVDAKGSLCTFIAAVAALPDQALAKARFICIGATEEEVPSSKGARHARQVYQPDIVLIGEPSGWDSLTLGYKGRLAVKAQVQKDHFHTAGEGRSAADDLTLGWQRVREWAEGVGAEGAGIFEQVQATLLAMGTSEDGLTQRAWATISLRLPLGLAPYEVEEAVRDAFGGLTDDLTFSGHESAVRYPKDNALTRALRVAIRAQGGTPTFKVKTGTSDMNVVAELWSVPTVAYGPGDSSLDHTPQERLDLAEYDKAVRVLTDALTRLAATAPA